MVTLSKIIAYIVFFIMVLLYFTPKQELYYFGEHELKKYKVIFSDEDVIENSLSLTIKNMKITYDSIDAANVQSVDIKLFGLYNSISVNDVQLTSIAANFIPLKIDNIEVKYTIIDPLNLKLFAVGEFGEVNARVNILDRNASLLLKPSKKMLSRYRSTLRQLRKNKQGEYRYAKTF